MPTLPQLLAGSVVRPPAELGDSLLGVVARPNGHKTSTVVRAVEHVRRMRGGSQSHLMRCSDGNYYVVKFQNNPQHRRVLVNELLGTILAARLALPTATVAIIEVSEDLIRLTPDLCIQTAGTRIPCQSGLQFGSRFVVDPRRVTVVNGLPDKRLSSVENLKEFVGMLVFDKWTCNADGRQVIFGRPSSSANYQAWMIDQGFCFNAAEWNFPDAPLQGLYFTPTVYEQVRGIEIFEPWLEALESEITGQVLLDIVKAIPPEWYEYDSTSINRLLERLDSRKSKVRELLWSVCKSCPHVFPNWTSGSATQEEKKHKSRKHRDVFTDKDLLRLRQACKALRNDLYCNAETWAIHYNVPEDLLIRMLTDWLVSDLMGVEHTPAAYFIPEKDECHECETDQLADERGLPQNEGQAAQIRAAWPPSEITSVEVLTDHRQPLPFVVLLQARSSRGMWTFSDKTEATDFAYGLAGWR